MKTLNFLKVWAVLFATVAFSGVLTSCSDDDDDPAVPTEWLVGEWAVTGQLSETTDGENVGSYGVNLNLDINADGTCYERYGDFNRWWLNGSTFGLGWYEDGEMWDVVQGNFEKVSEDKFTVKIDYTATEVEEDETYTIHTYGTLTFTRK